MREGPSMHFFCLVCSLEFEYGHQQPEAVWQIGKVCPRRNGFDCRNGQYLSARHSGLNGHYLKLQYLFAWFLHNDSF